MKLEESVSSLNFREERLPEGVDSVNSYFSLLYYGVTQLQEIITSATDEDLQTPDEIVEELLAYTLRQTSNVANAIGIEDFLSVVSNKLSYNESRFSPEYFQLSDEQQCFGKDTHRLFAIARARAKIAAGEWTQEIALEALKLLGIDYTL